MTSWGWRIHPFRPPAPLKGIIAVSAFAVGCGPMGGCTDAGPVSFQNDLLPQFERACGLSSACHQELVNDSKIQRVFLGCNPGNPNCAVASPGPTVFQGLMGFSQELGSMPYVKPGDPAKSFLLYKMDNNLSGLACTPVASDPIVQNAPSEPQPPQPCGASMPLGLPMLADLNIQVRAWIMQGAPNN